MNKKEWKLLSGYVIPSVFWSPDVEGLLDQNMASRGWGSRGKIFFLCQFYFIVISPLATQNKSFLLLTKPFVCYKIATKFSMMQNPIAYSDPHLCEYLAQAGIRLVTWQWLVRIWWPHSVTSCPGPGHAASQWWTRLWPLLQECSVSILSLFQASRIQLLNVRLLGNGWLKKIGFIFTSENVWAYSGIMKTSTPILIGPYY